MVKTLEKKKAVKFLVLPGDGIGEEITRSTIDVLDAVDSRFGLGLEYEFDDIGFASLKKYGTTLRDEVLEKGRAADGIILGPISHLDYPPRDQGGVNISAAFRVKLDLYANVRPARSRLGVGRTGVPVDLVIMRECTEGYYPDRNMYKGVGELCTPRTSSFRSASSRPSPASAAPACLRTGNDATQEGHCRPFGQLQILADGIFLDQVRWCQDLPEVTLEERSSMPAAMWSVTPGGSTYRPPQFLCRHPVRSCIGASGSLGLAGSIIANESLAAAQAQHGRTGYRGQDKANPTSLIISRPATDGLGKKRKLPNFIEAQADRPDHRRRAGHPPA
jgi:3-isopropylmalate dehydrogenase